MECFLFKDAEQNNSFDIHSRLFIALYGIDWLFLRPLWIPDLPHNKAQCEIHYHVDHNGFCTLLDCTTTEFT